MSSTIRCDIVSAEQEIFHGEATLVVATGELGELGIAPRHAPLITRLKPGKVVVTLPGGTELTAIVTNDAVAELGLAPGVAASAVIKASNIILGVPA